MTREIYSSFTVVITASWKNKEREEDGENEGGREREREGGGRGTTNRKQPHLKIQSQAK